MKCQFLSDYSLFILEGGYYEARDVSEQLKAVKSGEASPNIILDVNQLEFIQSFHIGILIKMKSMTEELGGKFMLVGDSEELDDILELMDLGFIVQRFKNKEEAIQGLAGV